MARVPIHLANISAFGSGMTCNVAINSETSLHTKPSEHPLRIISSPVETALW